ncbi:hypothetical protein JCM11251_002203 [Rhodosporidiobolus azoricus]
MDPRTPSRPAVSRRTSSNGSPTLPSARRASHSGQGPPTLVPRTPAPSSPSRRVVGLTGLPLSSSPLSSGSSASRRRRQSSFSSSVSNTTEATSYDESGDDCGSQEGADKEGSGSTGSASSSSSSFGTLTGSGTAGAGEGGASRRLSVTPAPGSHDFLAPPASALSLSASAPTVHAVSIPPASSLPISIQTSIPPSSVRLSTTPLFPSPLAQASGPEEDHEPNRGEDGDSEGEDDDDTAWPDRARAGSPLSREVSVPFGDLEFSPPPTTIPLPDLNTLGLEPTATPRPAARSRQRDGGPEQRESSPEHDVSRTARAPRVRSLGRSSGLSVAMSSAGDEASMQAKRRSRELSALTGLGVDTKGASSNAMFMTSTPTKSSALPASFSSMATSPPSPSSSLSISPSSVSRRSSINLVSPPRAFQPSSPSASRLSRNSIGGAGGLPIPMPFPAAPPPSESIKLQKVPESVRSALEFRQPGALSAAYLGEALSAPVSHGFNPSTSPPEFKIPKTPSATRAGSPASSPSTRSPHSSPPVSRVASLTPSRQPSQEKLGAVAPALSPPGGSAASSAFTPLFPFTSSAPAATPSSTRRDRSRSVNYTGGTVLDNPLPDLGQLTGPLPRTDEFGASPPTFNLTPFGAAGPPVASTDHRVVSDSQQRQRGHKASASISSMGAPPGAGSRLQVHRTSVAPTGTDAGGSIGGNSTDEYAQIILSTRNAKVRKWKTSAGASTMSTFEPGTAGTGKTWTGLGSTVEEVGEEEPAGREAVEGDGQQVPETREIEWVDWLDEYRKMKEAKLRADEAGQEEEAEEEEEEVERLASKKPSPPPPPTPRTEGFVPMEPALTAAQKGKAKATTTEYNPFEASTSVPGRTHASTAPFLTPGVPLRHEYFPLTAHASTSTGSGSSPFQPMTTATPMTIADPFEFAPLRSSISNAGSSASGVGSPGVRRKRNLLKLGHKIDAWWSAVRTSFAGAEEEKGRQHRRTSTDQPALTVMPTIEPLQSRTSSQFARPTSPGTPALRNVASAQDLSSRHANPPIPPNPFHNVVPTGALAPAARVDSGQHRLKPPATGRPGSSGDDSDGAMTSKTWRNPNLSLNLGPTFSSILPSKLSPRSSPSPRSTNPPSKPGTPSPLPTPGDGGSAPIPVPEAVPLPGDSPSTTPGYSPMWDRTPGLVPTSSQFPLREGERRPSNATRPKVSKDKAPSSFSMQTVRQQIRQRLASAKENCDKELRRIVAGITAYVETELHEDIDSPKPAGGVDEGRFGELVADESAGGYSSNAEYDDSGSEAPADVDVEGLEELANTDSDGNNTSMPPTRRQTPHLSAMSGARRQALKEASSSRSRSESSNRNSLAPVSRHRRLTSVPRGERPKSAGGSASSSRSTSRSRSPLPPNLRHVSGTRSPGHSSTATMPKDEADLAQSALIVLLQEITSVASEVLDTPISKLTAKPGSCADFISRVQQIGEAWTENHELPCRGWYVQLLLAIAGLSRVLEWWEAEKGFWTFDDAGEADSEPILFVAKPNMEDSPETRGRGESFSSVPSTAALQPPAPKWSPLGIDLGEQREQVEELAEDGRKREATIVAPEEEIKQRTEDLRQAVETIRAQTLLMELSLDGQLFQYLSSAWQELVGIDVEDCLDTPISDFLYPDDAAVFAEATRQLEADDSHTVEISFRLRVGSSSQTSQDEESPEDLYEAMEGKGMLMLDGMTGAASHTMWVVRPAPLTEAAEQAQQSLGRYGLDALHWRSSSDPIVSLHPSRLNMEPILCRICERPTPAWFFEKHNETCNEVHRLEGDISECNDRLKELLRTVDDLVEHLVEADEDHPVEYRGIPLTHSPAATPPTYLEGLRGPLAPKSSPTHNHQVRRSQQRIFDHVKEIVQIALSISTPSVTDETGEIPIQEQRLLSPNSENNLAVIMRWQRPLAEEPAMVRLVSDCEEQTRFKLNSVNRLRNTVLYAEKVRQEWEMRAAEVLQAVQEEARMKQPSPLPFDSPQLQPLPSDDSPRHIDALDLPRPSHQLRRQGSQPLGLLSPMMQPDDSSALSTSPGAQTLLSPRIPAAVPSSRTKASSIKDFKIIKPISKGAFGSVYLAKKITTGDYYAIKVLKKSDMVAKNQVTNVKAERMILMTQAESDFVVKLFYTFQSKDYLYLVMEYLPGGDCAALVKNMGELPEDWARRYIAEVVVGLEHLHSSGVIHRDLKPDNLLIDTKGHLKLTDFGLSRIGLLGRQTQLPSMRDQGRPSGLGRTTSGGPDFSNTSSPVATPALAANQSQTSYFGNVPITDGFSLDTPSESSGSSMPPSSHAGHRPSPLSPSGSASRVVTVRGPPGAGAETSKQHFVGTPDYLAPESILGVGMDACVDWWALGVICYEFLYGFPPFHDETPEKVFENIVSRRFEWHEDAIDISPEAHDFMDRLLCSDPSKRLGTKGATEVKAHPFLADIDWDNLLKQPVDFVPKVADPESTDYFDPRGATQQEFKEEEASSGGEGEDPAVASDPAVSNDPAVQQAQAPPTPAAAVGSPAGTKTRRDRAETAPSPHDDFGTFNFRNLTVLKQANDDVIRKLKDEQLLPPLSSLQQMKASKSRNGSIDFRQYDFNSPASPSSSSSGSAAPRTTAPSTPFSIGPVHSRQGSSDIAPSSDKSAGTSGSPFSSGYSPSIGRLRTRQPSFTGYSLGHSHHQRRNSLPSRLRKVSVSGGVESSGVEGEACEELDDGLHHHHQKSNSNSNDGRPPMQEGWGAHARRRTSVQIPPPSMGSGGSLTLSGSALSSPVDSLPPLQIPPALSTTPETQSAPAVETGPRPSPASTLPPGSFPSRLQTIDCLVAGRNPIVTKVLETMLQRLGCRVVVVPNGAEAILAAGGIPFDVLFLDIAMPVVDGEKAARMIKSTVNPSTNAPIVAVCSHTTAMDDAAGTLFAATLSKPIMKADLLTVLSHLGFKLEVKAGDERRSSADDHTQSSPVVKTEEPRRGSA